MTFECNICTMTVNQEGQETRLRYKVIYPAEGKVQFVTDKKNVAAEEQSE